MDATGTGRIGTCFSHALRDPVRGLKSRATFRHTLIHASSLINRLELRHSSKSTRIGVGIAS